MLSSVAISRSNVQVVHFVCVSESVCVCKCLCVKLHVFCRESSDVGGGVKTFKRDP